MYEFHSSDRLTTSCIDAKSLSIPFINYFQSSDRLTTSCIENLAEIGVHGVWLDFQSSDRLTTSCIAYQANFKTYEDTFQSSDRLTTSCIGTRKGDVAVYSRLPIKRSPNYQLHHVYSCAGECGWGLPIKRSPNYQLHRAKLPCSGKQ